jgi:hypothetical protein
MRRLEGANNNDQRVNGHRGAARTGADAQGADRPDGGGVSALRFAERDAGAQRVRGIGSAFAGRGVSPRHPGRMAGRRDGRRRGEFGVWRRSRSLPRRRRDGRAGPAACLLPSGRGEPRDRFVQRDRGPAVHGERPPLGAGPCIAMPGSGGRAVMAAIVGRQNVPAAAIGGGGGREPRFFDAPRQGESRAFLGRGAVAGRAAAFDGRAAVAHYVAPRPRRAKRRGGPVGDRR